MIKAAWASLLCSRTLMLPSGRQPKLRSHQPEKRALEGEPHRHYERNDNIHPQRRSSPAIDPAWRRVYGDGALHINNMPRKARLSPPASFFHVMSRGIEGRDIFPSDDDRQLFLSLLADGLKRTGYACYAWALMKNHYHLLLRSSELHLSQLMRPLNASYAQAFSRRHNRRGYLFQDRYKSIVTQDQSYVEKLLCYVHTNPLRAHVCTSLKELEVYPWTGHAVLMGKRNAPFQDTWPVLRRFGASIEEGRKGYLAFIAEAANMKDDDLSMIRKGNLDTDRKTPASYVIGDPEFVKEVLDRDRERRLQIPRHRIKGITMEQFASRFSNAAGIQPEELLRRSRGNYRSAVRRLFAYAAHRLYGFSIVDIARFLRCSHSPMSLAVRIGEKLAEKKDSAKILSRRSRKLLYEQ